MIHHPYGEPMKLSRKNCAFVHAKEGLLYHRCDTNPGSSGSAILTPDFDNPDNTRVVGVHTFGGCNSAQTDFNSGPAMEHLSSLSPAIKALVK
jgi:V8-like Glu-specific endopeptidase